MNTGKLYLIAHRMTMQGLKVEAKIPDPVLLINIFLANILTRENSV